MASVPWFQRMDSVVILILQRASIILKSYFFPDRWPCNFRIPLSSGLKTWKTTLEVQTGYRYICVCTSALVAVAVAVVVTGCGCGCGCGCGYGCGCGLMEISSGKALATGCQHAATGLVSACDHGLVCYAKASLGSPSSVRRGRCKKQSPPRRSFQKPRRTGASPWC